MSASHAEDVQWSQRSTSSAPRVETPDSIGDTSDALLVMNRLAGVRMLIDYYASTGILRKSNDPAYEPTEAEKNQVTRALLTKSSSEACAAELTTALLIVLRNSSYKGSSAVVQTYLATIHRQMKIENQHTNASLRYVAASPHWPAVTS